MILKLVQVNVQVKSCIWPRLILKSMQVVIYVLVPIMAETRVLEPVLVSVLMVSIIDEDIPLH